MLNTLNRPIRPCCFLQRLLPTSLNYRIVAATASPIVVIRRANKKRKTIGKCGGGREKKEPASNDRNTVLQFELSGVIAGRKRVTAARPG